MIISSKDTMAIPPGETIKEVLEDRNMTQKEFAIRMNMSEKHISKLINGEVLLTSDMAMRLEMVLGIEARFWCNLEALYREDIIRVKLENEMEEDKEQASKYPYKEMARYAWVNETHRSEEKVINLRKFFEVVRLQGLSENLLPKIIANKQRKGTKSDFALMAFAQKAKLEARKLKTKDIDIKGLEMAIPKIKELLKKKPKDLYQKLIDLLKEYGIALVFLPNIANTSFYGATFLDKNKIVIGIPIIENDIDKVCYSLLHELGHIVLGHLKNENGTSKEDELAANKLAKSWLA